MNHDQQSTHNNTKQTNPTQTDTTKNDNYPNTAKSNNGKSKIVLGIIALLLLTTCGVGFGIWAIIDKDAQNTKLTELQKSNETLQAKINNINSDTTHEEVSFGFATKNAEHLDYPQSASIGVDSVAYERINYTLSLEGEITARKAYASSPNDSETHNITEKIPGKIVNIATGTITDGNIGIVLFLLEDGSIAYALENTILSDNPIINIVKDSTGFTDIYGNAHLIDCAGYTQDKDGNLYTISLEDIHNENSPLILKK